MEHTAQPINFNPGNDEMSGGVASQEDTKAFSSVEQADKFIAEKELAPIYRMDFMRQKHTVSESKFHTDACAISIAETEGLAKGYVPSHDDKLDLMADALQSITSQFADLIRVKGETTAVLATVDILRLLEAKFGYGCVSQGMYLFHAAKQKPKNQDDAAPNT